MQQNTEMLLISIIIMYNFWISMDNNIIISRLNPIRKYWQRTIILRFNSNHQSDIRSSPVHSVVKCASMRYADTRSGISAKFKGQRHYAHDAQWKKNLYIIRDMVIIFHHNILPKMLSTLYDSSSEMILFQNMDE